MEPHIHSSYSQFFACFLILYPASQISIRIQLLTVFIFPQSEEQCFTWKTSCSNWHYLCRNNRRARSSSQHTIRGRVRGICWNGPADLEREWLGRAFPPCQPWREVRFWRLLTKKSLFPEKKVSKIEFILYEFGRFLTNSSVKFIKFLL